MRVIQNTKIRLVLLLVAIMLVHVASGYPSEYATTNVGYFPVDKNQKKSTSVAVQLPEKKTEGAGYDLQQSEKTPLAPVNKATLDEQPGSENVRATRHEETFSTRVRKVIAKTLDVPLKEVTRNAKLRKNLGADSLVEAVLSEALDKEFNIDIPDDDTCKLHKADTVGSYIDYITKRMNEYP